jgi:hypothetical protein
VSSTQRELTRPSIEEREARCAEAIAAGCDPLSARRFYFGMWAGSSGVSYSFDDFQASLRQETARAAALLHVAAVAPASLASARESRGRGRGSSLRRDGPSGSSSGDDDPPLPDLSHAARAVLRCAARMARRQRRRLTHNRRTAVA